MPNAPVAATPLPGVVGAPAATDWRTRYGAVENDLQDLIGAEASKVAPASGATDLAPRAREQLQQFRTNLQTFCAGTLRTPQTNPAGQLPPPTVAPPQTAGQPPAPATPRASSVPEVERTSEIMALLNHIEDTVDQALKKTPAVESARWSSSRCF